MNRKISREIAMKILYQMIINKDTYENLKMNLSEIIEEKDLENVDYNYIDKIVMGVTNNIEELDKKIEENLVDWKLNRISKVNLCILRLSVYEMFYVEDVPKKVAINEAVELGKKYSDNKAHKFINGVLAKFL
ncbi:transcription antitermination factor NusB [Hathewaya massiliensis]|uniref:transcription antitermination factor NusB n=1 Tax=Hathewaya massiliensis TaxID=1964382 RepID=UPI0011573E2C|nr:transcription antitermination factor NusB [Hathewaya massiliensis]